MFLEVMAAASMLGSVLNSIGAMDQGESTQEAYNYNAQVAEVDATYAVAGAKDQAALAIYRGKRSVEEMRAGYSAAGVRVDTGSPLTAEAEALFNIHRDASRIELAGEVAAVSDINKARLSRYYGDQARELSYYQAFGTLLTGGGVAAGILGRGLTSSAQTVAGADIISGGSR